MVMLLLVIVQFALYFHLRAVAHTAARHGLDHVRVIDGTTEAGITAANEFLDQSGSSLDGRDVAAERGSRRLVRDGVGERRVAHPRREPSRRRHRRCAYRAGHPVSRRGRDRGSVTVELAVLAPLVGLLLASVFLVGRVQIARADLEGAARGAARDLSIARDPEAARSAVEQSVAATLDLGSPSCRSMTFTAEIQATDVSVSIACVVDLQAAAVLPVPGSMTVSASATEVIDVYREGRP